MCRTLTDGLNWTSAVIAWMALAVVVFSGCVREIPPPCVSKCGMLLEDVGNGSMSCTYLQEAEDKMLEAGNELSAMDPRLGKDYACGQIFGWQLRLSEYVIGSDSSIENGAPWVGLSDCLSKEMHLMANQSWRKGSYPHEYFHMIQDCNPPKSWGNNSPNGSGHAGWRENGIYDIIHDFREGRR